MLIISENQQINY